MLANIHVYILTAVTIFSFEVFILISLTLKPDK